MEATPAPLIDVLSAESYGSEHAPGAINICVYETAFLDKARASFPDLTTPLTVYGWDDSTREARVAMEKLLAAGYKSVTALPGGLAGWKGRGGVVEAGSNPGGKLASGRFEIDPAVSLLRWTGRSPLSYHTGTLLVGSGHLIVENGQLRSGEVVLDLTTIRCSDITDSSLNSVLLAHLRSDDFFAVDRFPTAAFRIARAEIRNDATVGEPNYQIQGEFCLRGVTQSISFPAVFAAGSKGGFTAQAIFDVDRTRWGCIYGSGKFFARLGQHVVNDHINLHLKISTTCDPRPLSP